MKLCSSDNHYTAAPHYDSTLSVYWSFIVLRGFVFVCLCEIKSEYQQKKQYVSDLSKLSLPLFPLSGGVGVGGSGGGGWWQKESGGEVDKIWNGG